MFRYVFSLLQSAAVVATMALLPFSATPSLAQDEGLTFEQAQTRTAYARRQMERMRRELKDAEADEAEALREVEELRKRYEEAKKQAELATQARQRAEEKYAEARARWSEEAERLKRIHQRRDSPVSPR